MKKKHRIYPEKLIYGVDSSLTDSNQIYYKFDSKLFKHLKTLGFILRIFGFFPFFHKVDNVSGRQLTLKTSGFWLYLSLGIFAFQLTNMIFNVSSYMLYDSETFGGLVSVVWLLTPYIYFLQSLLYQMLMLFYRKKLPIFYSNMETLFKSVKIIPTSEIKFYNVLATITVFLLPATAYFSTCTVIKDFSYRNSSLETENCLIWYGYLYARHSHDNLWYFIIFLQFLAFFVATMSSLFMEQWLLLWAKSITRIYETHLENLDRMTATEKYVNSELITEWINKFADAHTLSEEFAFMTSPILFVSVITNPSLFCLQAFWVAKSPNYRMFKSWSCLVFPVFVLLSSFIRFSVLGLSGQHFKDSVSNLMPISVFSRK